MLEKDRMTNTDLLIFKNQPTKVKCIIIINKTIDINEKIQNNGIVQVHFYDVENILEIDGYTYTYFFYYKDKIIVII